MARSRHCRVCDGWHELEAWPNECRSHFATRGPRSDLAAPMLIRDGMEPIVSMADGREYDSKRAYHKSVRAAGCEIVGDDKAPFDKKPEFVPQGVGESIKQAYEQLESGNAA